ncbi:MAG: TPM domain-containing protein [Ruminococcus sp.]|nr:TPM domain-containing protein [Ruminococcus sp.]
MMKRIFSISLALLMIAVLIGTVSFTAAAKSGSYIFDEKEGISTDSFNELESTAQSVYNDTGISVCYLLTENLGGKPAQEKAQELVFSYAPSTSALVLVDSYDSSDYVIDLFAFGTATGYLSYKDDLLAAYNADTTYAGGVRNYLAKAKEVLSGAPPENSSYEYSNDLGGADGQLIVDGADLLSNDQETALTARCQEIGAKHNCSVVIVTSPALGGKTATQFADDYYDYHGYQKNGVLLLIALDNGAGQRAWAISTSGDCIKAFNESEQEKVVNDIKSDLSSKNWNKAFDRYLSGVNYYLSPHVAWYWVPLSLLLGFGISLLIMLAFKSQLKSVKMQAGAKDYVREGSMVVTASRDTFLYHTVTRTAKPKDTGSSGGGGGHIGSSGSSHGGSSGTF